MRLNYDYRDILSALKDARAEFLVVGAYTQPPMATPAPQAPWTFLSQATPANTQRVWKALEVFGAPRRGVPAADFAAEDTIFRIGVAPRRIDVITSISGVSFEQAWISRQQVSVDGIEFFILGREELIADKRAAGRPKGLADVAWLEQIGNG